MAGTPIFADAGLADRATHDALVALVALASPDIGGAVGTRTDAWAYPWSA